MSYSPLLKRIYIRFLLGAIVLTLFAVAESASAQTETALYKFSGPDGSNPYAGLVQDSKGNFYGTTLYGGAYGFGTVFKLTRSGTETVLYSFEGGADAFYPDNGALILDTEGNLYGTTAAGGVYGLGTVFEVTSSGKETVLYSFPGAPDGSTPAGPLIRDSKGNLYGTTYYGGSGACQYGCGAVFELTNAGKEKILYSFAGSPDGKNPFAGLVRGKDGIFYGTTLNGGDGCGTVYGLTVKGVKKFLYNFNGSSDGCSPYATLMTDENGNLYGTTAQGGINSPACYGGSCGTVFEVSSAGTETVLYSFTGPPDGANPFWVEGVVLDKDGNVYGATFYGGTDDDGAVYEISPNGSEHVLHSFTGSPDGSIPNTTFLDKKGNLYGTTFIGGNSGCVADQGCGIVFKLTP